MAQELPCPFEKKFPSELLRDDRYFMTLAYNECINAWRQDEVPVGAVIEYGGEVIARAFNRVNGLKDPTAHAEILAITQAAGAVGDWRLNDCTLYVTKEPCPMCSGATLMSRLQRVVYGIRDPKMGCLGGANNLNDIPTINHHFEITPGLMEAECLELFQAYFKLKRLKETGHEDVGTTADDLSH
ncbi:MAG: zinc-binding CMP/dCMP deaminase [Puniceicoccaceae bacterium 5H]|nr:MAG: zinc-binding CMP/dCMP deaminase [Puniceicoccaceae bacterium 5H]